MHTLICSLDKPTQDIHYTCPLRDFLAMNFQERSLRKVFSYDKLRSNHSNLAVWLLFRVEYESALNGHDVKNKLYPINRGVT